ncbi:MAG TPA: phosphate ABC transporter permease subunit PstC [Candidatus Acidoferrales bacterium]|nr:phosphate ABC transporter permease subunit PstC [Candidatus Acidoferrales bacterium]
MQAPTNVIERATLWHGPRAFFRRLRTGDEVAHIITLIFAAVVVGITALLVYQLWIQSVLSRQKFGWAFFFTHVWDPLAGQFGALPFLYGTLVTAAIGLCLAVPLGLGTAIFLSEFSPPRVSDSLAFLVDLLAAVPSVIYGLLGIFIMVPWLRTTVEPALKSTLGFLPLFQGPTYGVGFLAAGLILAVMVVPFIVSVSREVLIAVPREQREAALALGATRWETIWKAVVPFAKSGIIGSVFLALARALGETMAVTMVIGNDPKVSASLFAPGYSIAAVIANEFTEATGNLYLSALIELGLVLFVLTFVLNGLARLLVLATTTRGAAHE